MRKILVIIAVLVFFPILLAQDVPKKELPKKEAPKQEAQIQQQQQQQKDLNKVYKKQNFQLDSILKAKKDTIG